MANTNEPRRVHRGGLEVKTKRQSKTVEWHQWRWNRITASKCGDIITRRKDFEGLANRLHQTGVVVTQEMKRGLANEAAVLKVYCQSKGIDVQTFPCGLVINCTSPVPI
ncbi:hypothetical protein Btru_027145 [Bulinus truncatus]|nr:hypothetical protein Btru_027145 [Bulinus truncatus]